MGHCGEHGDEKNQDPPCRSQPDYPFLDPQSLFYLLDKIYEQARSSRSFVNPVFAQFETVLLCRFLAVKDRALDSFNFYNRAKAA